MNTDGNLSTSLAGFTILEIGDQLGDYAAMLLAGLGAEVIKLEPREGAASRRIGPFASTAPDPEQSIFFWRYNLNKKSAVLDVDDPAAQPVLARSLPKPISCCSRESSRPSSGACHYGASSRRITRA